MRQEISTTDRRALMAARVAEVLDGRVRDPITPRKDQTAFPLSSVQKRFWFTEQYNPGTPVTNNRICFRLIGRLNYQGLEYALSVILKRHEVLRARFANVDGEPVQSIAPASPVCLRLADFAHRPEAVREFEAMDAAIAESERPSDLSAGGLLRPALIRIAPDEHLFVLAIHHIVIDGWSLGIFLRELGESYAAAINRVTAPEREPLQIQYADFAAWQQEWLGRDKAAEQSAYWVKRLSGANTRLELPLDRPRPKNYSFNGAQTTLEIPAAAMEPLASVTRQHGATLFMALYAVYRLVLSRHTGQPDILVGTPVAGRVRSQIEPLIGCFSDTLVLRTPVDENKTFVNLLRSVKEEVIHALANQELPFDRLIEDLQPERDLSRTALIQTHFALHSPSFGELQLDGLQVSRVSLPASTARFELALDLFPTRGGLKCVFEYNTDLFAWSRIDRLSGHFEQLLRAIAERPAAKLAELDMLTANERSEIVFDWNRTASCFSEDACLHELIEAQARRTPQAVAVEFGDQSLTYEELDERSTKLANHLRRAGVSVESLVGVCLERSAEMLVTVLGVLKAGGAYIPLDPGFPEERLSYMLEDSGAAVLITSRNQLWRFANYAGEVVDIEGKAAAIAAESDLLPPSGVRPENLAYAIYTSGSTGKPKGVMIPHRAVVNFLHSMQKEPGLTPHDAVLVVTTLSFDIAVLEIYLPLIVGGRAVVADRETVIDGKRLAAELALRRITLMQATPATWRMLVDSGWHGDKRLRALCGGEAMSRELADALLKRVGALWNMYGPTETTVWSSMARVESEQGPVPIGRPIANTTIYVLDDYGRPVPAGVTGKLYIGGLGLARGYKNRPTLTSEKFILNPLAECNGERIYDTGDLARYRADGQLECLGRLDGQVKIRGYRIELGEIESALRRHKGVRDAVVGLRGATDEDKHLMAWLLPSGHGDPSTAEIRRHAGKLLPPYMVPSMFTFVDCFPMTPNGKIDRHALPAPDVAARTPEHRIAAAGSPLEATLARIFRELFGEEVFGLSPVNVTDNFFELGGHSLLAARLVARIEKETGHNIPVATLFEAPTVQQLARKLEDRTYTAAWSSLVELRKSGNAVLDPLFCIHWHGAKLISFQKIVSLLREDRQVYGLQPKGLDGQEIPLGSIQEMATAYVREIRACRPHGPYHLAGSCLGGVVAFEIAQQLIAEGEPVGLLVLLDAFMPGPLEHMHDRPYIVGRPDWYFGEFLLGPAAAVKRWVREAAFRLSGRKSDAGSSSRASDRLKKVNLRAASTYRPGPYPGKITQLMCSDGPFRTYEDRRLAWSSVAEGGFEIRIAPGNHTTVVQEPNIQVLAQHLRSCFDRLNEVPRASACAAGGNHSAATANSRGDLRVHNATSELLGSGTCA